MKRGLYIAGLATLALAAVAYGAFSWDHCGEWTPASGSPVRRVAPLKGLRAGAAKVELRPEWPVLRAGYPWSVEARGTESPLFARALVLRSGDFGVGLVAVDLLTIPTGLQAELTQRAKGLGLPAIWLVATHSHSSVGGYDPRLVSALSGTGRFEARMRSLVLDAATRSLQEAARRLAPATLALAEGEHPHVHSRAPDQTVDRRLTRLVFQSEEGNVGHLAVLAAHPTLWPRGVELLSPDYPGHLGHAIEEAEGGVALVLQGAVGNAAALAPEVEGAERPAAYARALLGAWRRLELEPARQQTLSLTTLPVELPRPDSRRLVPGWARRAADNVLCATAPRRVELALLELGGISLLAVPGEPTHEAARVLEQAAGASRAVSLVNDYVGYVETPARVERAEGEARRQYFGPGLLGELEAAAARLAGPEAREKGPQTPAVRAGGGQSSPGTRLAR